MSVVKFSKGYRRGEGMEIRGEILGNSFVGMMKEKIGKFSVIVNLFRSLSFFYI